MRLKLVAALIAAVLIVAAGATLVVLRLSGGSGPGHGVTAHSSATPTPSAAPSASTTVTPTPSGSATPTATPTPTAPIADACTTGQLDMVIGAATSGSGGQGTVTAAVANHSASACQLAGTPQIQLLDSGGAALATAEATPPAAGRAWLVPDRVALDPWEPQPGEASVRIAWSSGGTAAGLCSGSAPVVGELSLTFSGGASVTASVNTYPALPGGMTPCGGAVQVGAITQVSSAPTFTSSALAAAEAEVEQEEGESVSATPCTPTAEQGCLTLSGSWGGTSAAYFAYQAYGTGGGAVCYAYVYQDAAGWHPMDVLCTQASAPADGGTVTVSVPGGGCAAVHATPGHASSTVSCVSSSASATYSVEGTPTYVAETDPTSGLPMGTMWWYLPALDGWVAQDFVAAPGG